MPHMEASDPETSWKSAAKETAPWSQSGCLQAFAVSVPTVTGMEDCSLAPRAQAASVSAKSGH